MPSYQGPDALVPHFKSTVGRLLEGDGEGVGLDVASVTGVTKTAPDCIETFPAAS